MTVLSISAVSAQAATYLWSFTDGAFSGGGSLSTTGATATSGGGVINGDAVSLFINPTPGATSISPDGQWFYDNQVTPGPTNGGFLFTGIAHQFYNIWSNGAGLGPTAGQMGISDAGSTTYIGPGNGVLTLTAVPEPATWALMLGGFGLAGAALRRRSLVPVTA